MKPIYALLPDFVLPDKPFAVREIIRPHFSPDLHFHEECQLVHVAAGSGRRVIGNSVEQFGVGDLTFTGPNVPHVWYSDPQPTGEPVRSIALYINPQRVLDHFAAFVDVGRLDALFQQSDRGLRLHGPTREQLIIDLALLLTQSGLAQLGTFVRILHLLTETPDGQWLNKEPSVNTVPGHNQDRVRKLMEYIFANFQHDISLTGAASVAGMQVNAFCRFFKKLTQHTYADFVNEVRIGYACRLLQQTDLPITQVAYESGYSYTSYFNRAFLAIRGVTPREYRKGFLTAGISTAKTQRVR